MCADHNHNMHIFEKIVKMGVILSLLLACTIISTVSAETIEPATIDVTGTGTLQVAPDQAEISLAVMTRGENIGEIQRENAEKMANIISALKSEVGLSDKEISTSYYSIYEDWSRNDIAKTTGEDALVYRVSNTISIITKDVGSAGTIIDIAVANGANAVDSLQFSLTADTRRQYQEEVLQIAVEKATTEAKVVAEALGMKLGKPTYVQIGGSSITPYMANKDMTVMYGYGSAAPTAAPTPIQAEEVEVSASVSISYIMT